MIKYTFCPDQPVRDEKTYHDHVKWVKHMFEIIEEKGLEDKMHNLKSGEFMTLSCHAWSIDDTICYYFHCTGNKKGYFTQRILEPSGMTVHSNSLEFMYE